MGDIQKTVIVTGSAGFAGSHLVEYILEKTDWNIIGLDSFRHKGDAMRIHPSPRYKVLGVDLACGISKRMVKQVSDFVGGGSVYIVHMASESHVDRSITEPVPFVENNVSASLNVFELARELIVDKIIQISTDEVFGPAPLGVDYQEWDMHVPSNPYAASKSAQEMIGISYWRTYKMPLIIMRAMNMIGERQDPEKFLPMIIKKIQNGETVTIHGKPGNIGMRHYLHSKNFASAIVHVLENINPIEYEDDPDTIQRPECFNVCGDEELNNLELAERVAKLLGKELLYEFEDFHKTRPGHDRRYSLDGDKIRLTGWDPELDLDESIKKVIEFSNKNPLWLEEV